MRPDQNPLLRECRSRRQHCSSPCLLELLLIYEIANRLPLVQSAEDLELLVDVLAQSFSWNGELDVERSVHTFCSKDAGS